VRRPLPDAPPEPIASAYAMFLLMYGMTPGRGVHLVVSPMYHTAVVYFATSALHLGHRVVVMDRWTPEGMLEAIQTHRITHTHMVPTQLVRLLEVEDKERFDVSSLEHMIHSAAPCPLSVKHAMLDWWGPVLYEYYAASEGGGTMVTPQEWLERPGTVGKAWQTAEVAIFDDEGHRLPAGEVGTVYIKMQQGFEYHGDKDKTEEAWRTDGYFTVGDAGYMDAEGYLFLMDRKADMIISGGVNIYPAEIEGALMAHPDVLDVAVFGIPDADWGEQVKAVIEVREERPGLEGELFDWARERLASYKCPRTIDFVEGLPRDPNGKLKKRLLRDPYWEGRERSI
jgi:long-chain acyl-CoA synthetase